MGMILSFKLYPLSFRQVRRFTGGTQVGDCAAQFRSLTSCAMNLEDHLGDIISKARTAANVSAEDAARAAGLGLDEFAELEETGRCAKRPGFQALAAKIGLDGAKLEGIARGWLPQKRDLGSWRELRQIITAGPGYKVHCDLVWDEVPRDAAVVDSGFETEPRLALVHQNQRQVNTRC